MLKKILIVIGVAYLAAEFWFNGTLLNTLGAGNFSEDQLHTLEQLGKGISGVGLWLAVMKGLSLLPQVRRASTMWLLSGSVILLLGAIGLMATLQTGIAEWLADTSSPAERKAAMAIATVVPDLVNGNYHVDGFDFTRKDYRSAEGKTFVALFPAFAIHHPEANARFGPLALDSVENRRIEIGSALLKTPWDSYQQAVGRIRQNFDTVYKPGSDAYLQMGHQPPDEVVSQYLRNMDAVGVNIDQEVTRDRLATVRKQFARDGIELPEGWQLNDLETLRAAAAKGQSFAAFAYEHRKIKTTLPAGLDWPEYAAHPEVQGQFPAAMEALGKRPIPLDLSKPQFEHRLRAKLPAELRQKEAAAKAALKAPVAAFADGGEQAEAGRAAVKRAKVPVISLGLSCLFATINLIVLVCSMVPGWLGKLVTLALVSAVLVMPMGASNRISGSPVFESIIQREDALVGVGLTWVTNVQPFTHWVGNALAKGMPLDKD